MQHYLQHSAGRRVDDHSVVARKPLLKFPQLARSQKRGSYCYRHAVRSSLKPETQRQSQGISAPPVRLLTPPPPPPPPQATGPSRRTLLGIVLGGSLLSYAARKSTEPKFYKDEYGIRYLKTDKGSPVAVTADRRGNIMMVDRAGNLYYDAGSPQLGVYMVTMQGELYTIYMDDKGEQQTSLLGNVKDLRSIKVKEIGGIPIEKLQAHYEIQRNRAGKKDGGLPDRIVGFPDKTNREMPPDSITFTKTGKGKIRLEAPPVLDDAEITLEEKKNLWPFTQIEPGGGKFHRGFEHGFE